MNIERKTPEWIFTNEERRKMTAQMLQELRKTNGLQQKEVAAYIDIKATTYNTYESGRTEPPLEILVRLSHLYNVSLDLILQKTRTYRNAQDIANMIEQYRKEIAEADEQIKQNPENSKVLTDFKEGMYKMIDMLHEMLKNEEIQNKLEL